MPNETNGRQDAPQTHAEKYLRAGLSIIPIRPGGAKQPAIKEWKPYQKEPPPPACLDWWWGDGRNGIALVCGRVSGDRTANPLTGREVLDLDDAALLEPFRELVESQAPGLLDRLPLVESPRPGYQFHYNCPVIEGNRKLAQKPGTDPETGRPRAETLIETRGEGGYILLPGSPPACHETGRTYRHIAGPPITEAPTITPQERQMLFEAARSFDRMGELSVRGMAQARASGAGERPGDDFNRSGPSMAELIEPHGWVQVRQNGAVCYWRRPGKAEGHSATTGYCHGPNGEGLFAVFSSNAHPFEGPNGRSNCTCYTKFAVYTLLNYGGDFKAAARQLARQGYGSRGHHANGVAAGAAGEGVEPEAGEAHRTDLGNAQRLVERHGPELRHCHPWKKWLAWDGRRWRIDDTGAIVRRATDTLAALEQQAVEQLRAIQEALKNGPDEATADILEGKLAATQKLLGWCLQSESRDKISSMIELARSRPGIPILPAEMDRDPYLLNVVNGTLDLRTGQLRPHAPADLLTKLCPVVYHPDAPCPLWEKFLETTFQKQQELIAYLQRLLGYCLTGDVSEQILAILWGSGANGKSTLISIILEMLGEDYAVKASRDLFMARKSDQHPTLMARLFGKRLVVGVESQEGGRLDEGLVKELTGGDPITARRMREDYWQFNPTHKALLITNHKPEIRGTDEGIRRRPRLIPFMVRFWDPNDPDEVEKWQRGELTEGLRQDKKLLEKLREEKPGILGWCVRGCRDWQQNGLGMPEEVKTATRDYLSQQDVLKSFLDECCHTGSDNYRGKASVLYGVYRLWCEDSGERYANQRQFGESLSERGFVRYRDNGIKYKGVAVRQEWLEKWERTHGIAPQGFNAREEG